MVFKKVDPQEIEVEKPKIPMLKEEPKKIPEVTNVVINLPTRPIRSEIIDGKRVNYVTIEEFLTRLANQEGPESE
jgi:hypothetical protein